MNLGPVLICSPPYPNAQSSALHIIGVQYKYLYKHILNEIKKSPLVCIYNPDQVQCDKGN